MLKLVILKNQISSKVFKVKINLRISFPLKELAYIFYTYSYTNIEGMQSLLLPNMSFKTILVMLFVIFKTWKIQTEPLTFCLTALKNFERGPDLGRELSLQIAMVHYELVWYTGRKLQRQFDQSPFCIPFLKMVQQILLYQIFAFPSSCEFIACSLKLQTTTLLSS